MLNSICTSLTDNVCGKYRKVLSDNKFVSSGLFTVTEYYHWIDTIYKLNGDEVKDTNRVDKTNQRGNNLLARPPRAGHCWHCD